MIEVYCYKEKIPWRCRPDKGKKKDGLPKFYCNICKRYVLPDAYHKGVVAFSVMDKKEIH